MRVMKCLALIAVLASACLVAAGTANAVTTGWVTIAYKSVSPNEKVNINVGGVATSNVLAGVYNLSILKWVNGSSTQEHSLIWADLIDSDGDGIMDAEASDLVYSSTTSSGTVSYKAPGTSSAKTYKAGPLASFCMDLHQSTSTAYKTYYIYEPEDAPIGGPLNSPIGEAKASDLRKLWENYFGYTGTAVGAATFQACVWEIVGETGTTYDIKAGTFKITSTETWQANANTWLWNLAGLPESNLGLRALVSEGFQDFAIVVPGVGAEPVPEPVTMAGLMLGIGSVVTYVRKRRTA